MASIVFQIGIVIALIVIAYFISKEIDSKSFFHLIIFLLFLACESDIIDDVLTLPILVFYFIYLSYSLWSKYAREQN